MNCSTPLAFLPILALLSLAQSQDPQPAASDDFGRDRERIRAMAELGLGQNRAYELLRELLAKAPHRLAGSKGAAEAVAWARQCMQALAFDAVREEECWVPHWERGNTERLELLRSNGEAAELLAVSALGGSVATAPEGLSAGLLVVESFKELLERGEEARGKFVLFNQPMQPALPDAFAAYGGAVIQRSQGAIQAAKAGAVGALVRSMTFALNDFPHTGAMSYQEGLPRVPAAAVSTLAAARLAQLAREESPVLLRLTLSCETHADALSANVVGELRGREWPEEIILVCAHLDGWDIGQGAHDDGAGSVQVIEALRLIQASGVRPRRTVRGVLFMNEENGLAGAKAYRAAHDLEVANHVFAIETDRGGFSPRGFSGMLSEEWQNIVRAALCELEPFGAGELRPGSAGADLSVFSRDGLAMVGYLPDSTRYFDVHHCDLDRLEAVHPRELELGAISIAALALMIADYPTPLPR